jgi:2-amino-4-hydroxy-6-hydroxymethyldihydropteridine diphosphokinase
MGDRLRLMREASRRLADLGAVTARSPIYETAPLGPPQPEYLNAVVALMTALEPTEILSGLLGIEAVLGRVRRERWGPRLIDLDLLALEAVVQAEPGLTLPHPEIPRRAFVLRPWLDVDAAFWVPGMGTVRELWEALPQDERLAVRPLAAGWNESNVP